MPAASAVDGAAPGAGGEAQMAFPEQRKLVYKGR